MSKQNDNKPATQQDLTELKNELKAEINSEAQRLDEKIDAVNENLTKRMDKSDAQTAKNTEVIERLAVHIVHIEQEMETKTEANRKYNNIMNILDKIMKRFDIYDSERAASEYTFRQHQGTLENHEQRLIALERKP